jgi:hypothetical protein
VRCAGVMLRTYRDGLGGAVEAVGGVEHRR